MAKTKNGGAVAHKADKLPAAPGDFEQDSRRGFEGAKSRSDFAIPFVVILQSLSPQVDGENKIQGAKPGMFYNTVTGELSSELTVIPCRYTRTFVEWVPRNAGGGFRGERDHTFEAEYDRLRDPATGKAKLPGGNEIADTRNFYVLVEAENGALSPAVISMGSTQIKKARNWNTFMQTKTMPGKVGQFVPAMFASRFRLTTKMESNKKGKWYGWGYEWLGFINSPAEIAYQSGKVLSETVASGNVSVDRTQTEVHETSGAESDDL
jgi:hypothetical protein